MYVYFETESTKIITAVFPALELLRRVYDTDAHYIGISLETIYGTPDVQTWNQFVQKYWEQFERD